MGRKSNMECPHKTEATCEVVKRLAGGVDHMPSDLACKNCQAAANPMDENCVTMGMAVAAVRGSGGNHREMMPALRDICLGENHGAPMPDNGPGAELQKLLSWFAKPTKKCRCKEKAAVMNRWGVAKCRQNIETIVDWLMDELARRGFLSRLVPASAVRAVVTVAIDRAEGKQVDSHPAISELESELGKYEEKKLVENNRLVNDWPFVWTYYSTEAVGDELRYSIRSVLKWQPDARVIVIGDKPAWYSGECIEKPRISKRPHQAFKDCYSKILQAAKLHDRFIWMMDDVYWVKQFWMDEAIVPKYVRHVSQQRFHAWKPKNKWARTRQAAYQWLLANNRPTYDFASHLPQPIESVSLLRMESELRLLEQYKNWECVYFNAYFGPVNAMDWGRRFTRVTKPREQVSTNHKVLNHTHRAYAGGVEKYLQSLFPDKSRVEI